MRVFICLFVVSVVAGCASQPSQPPPETAARNVLKSYRIPAMLGQTGPIIIGSLRSNLPAEVEDPARQQLRKAIEQVFDSQALLERMADSLVSQAREADRIAALYLAAEKLQSELAQRMIALEEGAADEEFADGFGDFLSSLQGEPQDKRMQQARQLADSLRLVDLQIAFNVGMLRGMVRARNAAAPEPYTTSEENLDRMTEQAREGIARNVGDQLPLMLYYVYRDVPKADMAEYTALQSKSDMRWLNKAVATAMERSLKAAAREVGQRYAELPREAGGNKQEGGGSGSSEAGDDGAV